jgi:Adenylate and Guanylate cyclase catalytic domain
MGDGIMALFGAPIAHEDHAVRACYAALAMQEAVKQYAEAVFRRAGLGVQIRVGLNSGEVVVRAIGSDLRMDYTAVGQTTHLAARIEQTALPGTILLAPGTLRLAEGYVQVRGLGPIPIKGLAAPVEVYAVVGAGLTRTRLQAAVARGLTRFVGRDAEFELLRQSLGRASARGRSSPGWASRVWANRAWSMSFSTRTTRGAGGSWRAAPCRMAKPRRTCRSVTCSKLTVTSRTAMTSGRCGPRSLGICRTAGAARPARRSVGQGPGL